ncbi:MULTISPECIES: hypothetical protein [unclassified Streptomyces]|uniref:hypothetical protein n=1 Tax=unclassified Streptomyces TaxID=2593676 RepID=UPI00117EBBF1|nr:MULTISPECIES: hypothetical protein [unclassified Streptomyces]
MTSEQQPSPLRSGWAARTTTSKGASTRSCAFYPRLGFTERARVRGVPGGHEDIYFHKRLLPPKDETAGGHPA